jgi:hypothetical protein
MKKITINTAIIIVFISVQFIVACDDTVLNSEDIPTENVSYSKHIQPIFNTSCALIGCHDNSSAEGNISLTSWSNATLNPLVISPENSDNSRLVWAIQGLPGTALMPPIYGTVPPLDEKQIQGIITWIDEGAKNN